jgi:hypothetical protein
MMMPMDYLNDVTQNHLSSLLLSAVEGPPEVGGVSYSKASYYTILGLYVLSFPGVWSQVKRSTSAKIKRKTFVTAGENTPKGKSLRQQAGEIMACTCGRMMAISFFSDSCQTHSTRC